MPVWKPGSLTRSLAHVDLGQAAYIDFLDVNDKVCGVWVRKLGVTLLE